jgi:Ras-related GTP-binding protein A/B
MAKKKVLLMGKAHSGKTSMRSIIFANYLARDTTRLSPTLDVEHHHVRFLGDLVLNLWDCGGQDAFYESYFERDRETIFRSVELLIYVFDIESDCPEKDFDHFCGVLEAIEENSPDARIFILIHKMDLVAQEDREAILEDRKRLIEDSCRNCGVENFQCFGTSIWDETLYKAWSEIVTNLIPNIRMLETQLEKFCKVCDADEVVLFERATFLVISHAQCPEEQYHLLPPAQQQQDAVPIATAITASNANTNTNTPPSLIPNTTNGIHGAADYVAAPTMADDDQHPQVPSIASSPARTAPTEDGSDMRGGDAATPSTAGGIVLASTVDGDDSAVMMVAMPPPSSSNTTHTPRHISRTPHFDAHRFEKISNIVKQFKLSCGKAQSQFQGMQVRNSRFSAFIDAFTANTYIMVIVSNPRVHTAATLLNIQNARNHFERFIPRV